MTDLDKTDRRILAQLELDGGISTVDLAERIGLSPTSTSERLRRLQLEGYVTGFRAMPDLQRVCPGLFFFLDDSLDMATLDVV